MKIYIKIILFLLVVFPSIINSQYLNYRFKHYNLDQGLSQSVVIDILQDQKGFIWIGTQDGLNRFDGYEFKVFRNVIGDSTSLSHNYARTLFEDSKGNIWIGTNGGGVNIFDHTTEKFKRLIHKPNIENTISSNYIESIKEDKSGNIWIGTYDKGLNKIERTDTNFRIINYRHNPNKKHTISSNYVYAIETDKYGRLWVGTDKGLNLFDNSKNSFVRFNEGKGLQFLSDDFVRDIFSDSKGNLWIATDSGGVNYISNKSLKEIVEDPRIGRLHTGKGGLSGLSVNSIAEDPKGNLWFGVWGGGINKYNKETKEFEYFQSEETELNSLKSDDIIKLYFDSSRMLWAGTYGSGLFKLNPYPKAFYQISANNNSDLKVSNNIIKSIYVEDEEIFVGSWNGLNRLSLSDKKTTKYVHDPNDHNSISNNRIMGMTKSAVFKNLFWIATLDGGVNLYDKRNNEFFEIINRNPDEYSSNKNISKGQLNVVHEDGKGFIWLGTLNGKLFKSKYSIKKYKSIKELKENISLSDFQIVYLEKEPQFDFSRIETIYEDSDGIIWVGTYKGLLRFDAEGRQYPIINCNGEKSNSIEHKISTINEANNGDIWVGTFHNGIFKIKKSEKLLDKVNQKNFTEVDGLSNNYIYSIVCDNDDNLWISTNKGLTRFDLQDEDFTIYSKSDGLQSDEFKSGAFYDKKSNRVYLGGIGGIIYFIPSEIKKNKIPPKVVITDLFLMNKPIKVGSEKLTESITETNSINLSYKDYILTLEFSALHYVNPEKNKIAYKLEGFEENWNYTDSKQRKVTYTNLDGGQYIFKVRASNSDGVWNNKGASLNIQVFPPFYKTTWFIIFTILIIIPMIYYGINLRIKSIEKQKNKLEKEVKKRTNELNELNKSKDKFFSLVAHDIKGPFNIFMGNSQFLAEDLDSLSKEEIKNLANGLKKSSESLYKLLENLLNWSKMQMGGIKVNKVKLNLVEMVNNNISLLSDFAKHKEIEIIFESEGNFIVEADSGMLNTILRNIITNALKFSERGSNILIEVKRNEDLIVCSVEDRGIGIPADMLKTLFKLDDSARQNGTENETGTGLGLIITKEFIELNNGTIKVDSQVNKGTKISFTLPAFQA